MSNGGQTEPVKNSNKAIETAEITSSLFSTNPLVSDNNTNKDLNTIFVNKEQVDNSDDIHEVYVEFASKGISKPLFQRVLKEVQEKQGILNFKAYLHGTLNKVVYHRELKAGNIVPKVVTNMKNSDIIWYNWLNE
jgi:hypothetical protein